MVDADGHGVRTRSLQGRARHRSGKTYSLKHDLHRRAWCEDTLAAGAGKAPQRQDLPAKNMVDTDGHGVRTRSPQGQARHRSGKTYQLQTWLTPMDLV